MRFFRVSAVTGVLLALVGGRLIEASEARRARRPNILLLFTDQQHAGMLSCAGNPHVKTPAMDSLAASGAGFERAYCANPVCVPSRFSMMTGVLPSRIGMEDNSGVRLPVPPEILAHTLGRIFRDAGYETAYGGKVHTPMGIPAMGFEMISRDQRGGLADACVEFLRKRHERPFLLVASFINPHDICYMAIRDYAEKSGTPEGLLKNARVELQALCEALKLPAGVSREEFFARLCPPLLVSWKRVTKPGLVDRQHLVSTGLDLIPTLCDFASIPVPSELKGRSVRELAEGREPKSWRESLVVENGRSRMLRTSRHKYVLYESGSRREQLIDLGQDPGEMKNLALDPSCADVLKEHRRLLKKWYQENHETLGEKYVVP